MKKKFLPVLLALAIVVGLLSVPASALIIVPGPAGSSFKFKVVDSHGEEVKAENSTVTYSDPYGSPVEKPLPVDEFLIIFGNFSYTVSAEGYKSVTVEDVDAQQISDEWEKVDDEDGKTIGYIITVTLERPDGWEEPENEDLKAEKDEDAVVNGFWGVKVSGFKGGLFYTIRIASSTAQDSTSVIIPLSGKDVAGMTYTFQCKKGQVITVNEYTSPDVLNDAESGDEVKTITTVTYTCE